MSFQDVYIQYACVEQNLIKLFGEDIKSENKPFPKYKKLTKKQIVKILMKPKQKTHKNVNTDVNKNV